MRCIQYGLEPEEGADMTDFKANMLDDIIDALATAKQAYRLLPSAPANMKPVHFRVLNAICRIRDDAGSSRISDISRALGFQLPNTTKFVNELVEMGILRKSAMPSDRRAVLVRTTEVGEKYLQECVLTFRKRLQDEFSEISESDWITMIETIRRAHELLKRNASSSVESPCAASTNGEPDTVPSLI